MNAKVYVVVVDLPNANMTVDSVWSTVLAGHLRVAELKVDWLKTRLPESDPDIAHRFWAEIEDGIYLIALSLDAVPIDPRKD